MNSVQYRVAQPHVNSRTMQSRRSHTNGRTSHIQIRPPPYTPTWNRNTLAVSSIRTVQRHIAEPSHAAHDNKGVHMDHITLNNGVTIPQVGLGTYLLEPDDAQ